MTADAPEVGADGTPTTVSTPTEAPTGPGGGEGGREGIGRAFIAALRAQPHARAGARADTDPAPSVEADTPPGDEPRSLWTGRPESLQQTAAYVRAGGWIPGRQPAWLEVLGMLFGFGFALPVRAALRAVDWVVMRWSRALFAALVVYVWWALP